jgi:hypothetical protein
MPQFFSYRPAISIEQFFKYGYAEQKMILCIDVINLVRQKDEQLHPKVLPARPTSSFRGRPVYEAFN